jgi:hypothetical protein
MGSLTRASRERGAVNLEMTLGWGYAGHDGVIMPGGGRMEVRAEWPARGELESAIRAAMPSVADPFARLGFRSMSI